MKPKRSLALGITLGRQVERVLVREHGHERWTAKAGGESFASLFPSMVGQTLTITQRGLELAGNAIAIRAVGWLSANGYFVRGGLQS